MRGLDARLAVVAVVGGVVQVVRLVHQQDAAHRLLDHFLGLGRRVAHVLPHLVRARARVRARVEARVRARARVRVRATIRVRIRARVSPTRSSRVATTTWPERQ